MYPMARNFLDLVHSAGYTLTSLGKVLNLDRSYLSNVGAGRRPLKLARAVKIAKTLGTNPEALLKAVTPTAPGCRTR